jgi:hypothetical protein
MDKHVYTMYQHTDIYYFILVFLTSFYRHWAMESDYTSSNPKIRLIK